MTTTTRTSMLGRCAFAAVFCGIAFAESANDAIARKLEAWLVAGARSAFKAPPRTEPAGAEAMRSAAAAVLSATFSKERWRARAEIASELGAYQPKPGFARELAEWYVESKLGLGAQCEFAGGRVLLAGNFEPANSAALATELAVLLFDQNVGLPKFLDQGDDDERIARRMTLIGLSSFFGERTVAMHASELAAMLTAENARALPPSTLRDTLAAMQAPQYAVERFALEEERGLKFVERVYAEGGADALRNLLTRPPRTTAEVLHPQVFVTAPAAEPHAIEQLDLASKLGPKWTTTYAGRIGEFEAELIFRLGGDAVRARMGAEGFGVDSIRLYADESARSTLLHWSIVADSESDAVQVFDALKRMCDRIAAIPSQSLVAVVTADPAKTRLELRSGHALSRDDASHLPLCRLVVRRANRIELLDPGNEAFLDLDSLLPP